VYNLKLLEQEQHQQLQLLQVQEGQALELGLVQQLGMLVQKQDQPNKLLLIEICQLVEQYKKYNQRVVVVQQQLNQHSRPKNHKTTRCLQLNLVLLTWH